MAHEVIFEGEKHKITTDGEKFYLYTKLADAWSLISQKSVEKEFFTEVIKSLKELISADVDEEEKIARLSETGFFQI
ncbi:MAG: hypothetical protein J7K72_02435 [Candidatus Aenigmarchaeota archaeon]|nr:hypothetical protein [Candidatus Aenigmarchaeota archaeon]